MWIRLDYPSRGNTHWGYNRPEEGFPMSTLFEFLVGGATIIVVPFVVLTWWYAREDYLARHPKPGRVEAALPRSRWQFPEGWKVPALALLGAVALISNWTLLAATFGWTDLFQNQAAPKIEVIGGSLMPAAQPPEKREYTDATAEFLMGLYQDKPTFQGEEIFHPFIGKWMHLNQLIYDFGPNYIYSYLEKSNGKRPIVMFFDDPSRIATLKVKQKVSLGCQIWPGAKVNQLIVGHCEFEGK
jgi:hypothetical protein